MPNFLSLAVAECAQRHKRHPEGMAILFIVPAAIATAMSYSFPSLLTAFLDAKPYLPHNDVILTWGLVVAAALLIVVMWMFTMIVAVGWKVRNRPAWRVC